MTPISVPASLAVKPGEEVEERLVAREARDRREDAERVGREEDDRARMARPLLRQRVRDLLELVRGAGVLGLRLVVQVEDAALVHDDVLEHRAERVRRLVDLGLRIGGEPDHLRVAAALEVEDAGVAPAVLVVADEAALGIGRERRLAGPGEPEEDRHAALVVHVGRAVHREDAFERKAVVHDGEDRLLDLAGVLGAADQHFRARGMEDDERLAARPVLVRVGLDLGRVEDDRVGLEVGELGLAPGR